MAETKRRVSEPTHPSVWAGLVLAVAGLLVALYAYTGPRVYDIVYFFAALAGGLLALGGILAAAWGRALGASRRKRAEKAARFGAPAPAGAATAASSRAARGDGRAADAPPTVAAPADKRTILARLIPKGAPKEPEAPPKPVFAFRRRGAGAGPGAAAPAATAAAAVSVEPAKVPVRERLSMACPNCGEQFAAEGVRSFTATCPKCAFSAEV
jgi:predicted RNA-binding Zn-ribbon protein involved in translation (DUF1610 family)